MSGAQPPIKLPLPSTVMLLMFTALAFCTRTCAATGSGNGVYRSAVLTCTPPTGDVMTAESAAPLATPERFKLCVMVTCSGYVPGQTLTVPPGELAFTAF